MWNEYVDQVNDNVAEENGAGEGSAAGDRQPLLEIAIGRFVAVKRWAKKELALFTDCVKTASPDRASAVVLFLILLAGSFTCMLSRYLLAQQFPNDVVPWLIISFELAATGFLLLMLRYADVEPADDSDADADLQPWHRLFKRNIKLFGIVPFYFAIFVFDVFRFTAEASCFGAWTACTGDVLAEHVADLVYPLARMFYLLVELWVCYKFNAHDLVQNTLVLYGLAFVQATNLSGWMDALVGESVGFLSDRNWTDEIERCLNGSDVNVSGQSDHFVQCFRRNSGEYEVLRWASPYLFPFIMEYLMLVMECVADWFFSNADHGSLQHGGTSRLEHGASAASIANNGSAEELVPVVSFDAGDQHQQGANAAERRVHSSDSNLQSADSDRQDDRRDTPSLAIAAGYEHVAPDPCYVPASWYHGFPWQFLIAFASLIASVLFVVFGIDNYYLGNNIRVYLYLFMCYRSGYWLTLSIVALIGYAASRRLQSGPMNPKGFEYFVILSSVGPIIQSVLTTVAYLMSDGYLIPTGMLLTEAITNVMHIFIQVAFYAHVKSVQIRAKEGEAVSEFAIRCKRSILLGVSAYFAVCNFAIWVEDSFIETHYSEISWLKQYIHNWPLVYNAFNPLALVFRFNSALLFLNVLFDKQR